MIQRHRFFVALAAAWVGLNLYLCFSDVPLLAGCDHRGASGSTGACYVPQEGEAPCASSQTQDLCNTINHVEVKEDFPLECVALQNYNCNQPLADCWRFVSCIWEHGRCRIDQGTSNWTQEKKRISKRCSL
jgi:hypothetical protein